MTDITQLDAARHEAGHAVMHVFLGLDNLDDVSVIPSTRTFPDGMVFDSVGACSARKFAFGLSKMVGVHGYVARLECRKYVLVAWAGPESGMLTPRLSHTDHLLARSAAKCVTRKSKKLIACYQSRARGIIRRRLKHVIDAFADILIERRQIAGGDAEKIILRLLKIDRGHGWIERGAARFARRDAARGEILAEQ